MADYFTNQLTSDGQWSAYADDYASSASGSRDRINVANYLDSVTHSETSVFAAMVGVRDAIFAATVD